MDRHQVAVFLDFENLAVSAENSVLGKRTPLSIERITAFALGLGNVWIKYAYADWSKETFAKYQHILIEQGYELVHLPSSNLYGKNGADVRLAIDVMELLEKYPIIDTFLIGSGDADFIPLIQRVQFRNKKVIIIGFEHSVAQPIRKNSAGFKSLENLLEEPKPRVAEGDKSYNGLPGGSQRRTGDQELLGEIRKQIKEIGSVLEKKEDGAISDLTPVRQLLESLEEDLLDRIDEAEDAGADFSASNGASLLIEHSKAGAEAFLMKKIRYRRDHLQRTQISQAILSAFLSNEELSMERLFDGVHEELISAFPKADIRKYINTLFTGGAFRFEPHTAHEPLLRRPLRTSLPYNSPEALDSVYIQRVSEILQKRYNALSSLEILDLLF